MLPMKLRFAIRKSLVFATVAQLLIVALALAAQPEIKIESESFYNRDTSTVEVRLSITNEYNKPVKEIELVFNTKEKNAVRLAELGAGESQRLKREFTFETFALSLPGVYQIPYLLTYKDSEGVASTDHRIMVLKFPPLSARALEIFFDQIDGGSTLLVKEDLELGVTVRSIAPYHLAITNLRAVVRDPVSVSAPSMQFPAPLAPSEMLRQTFLLHPAEGKPGYRYDSWIIVDGEALGRHFSEAIPFAVLYPEKHRSMLVLYLLLFIIVICLVVLGARLFWHRRRKAVRLSGAYTPSMRQFASRGSGATQRPAERTVESGEFKKPRGS